MSVALTTAWLAVAVILGVAVPWLFVRMLAPKLAESEHARRTNYRGREVFLGLGVAWLVWAGGAIIAGAIVGAVAPDPSAPFAAGILVIAGPLALVGFALGMVDDTLGTSADRGFRGHLRELARGRLTTGMLKLIGLSLASLVCAAVVSDVAPWGSQASRTVWRIVGIVGAGAAVALTSNLVNLVDLRPGRALKVYGALALAGSVASGLVLAVPVPVAEGQALVANRVVAAALLAIFALGPIVAVWRYDLGERGMLGDAGANPMGAVAGLLIAASLPGWGLAAYLLLVLGLNLASERVSFSEVIDRTPVLRALDRLGTNRRAGPDDARAG